MDESKEHRSWNMSRIKGKDTQIELKVRKALFARGFRYRKNDKRYPGTPDIVFPKYKTAVFINGCFWHRHNDCKYAYTPKSRTEFWQVKFQRNVENDEKNHKLLEEMGWKVIVIWECEIKQDFNATIDRIVNSIQE